MGESTRFRSLKVTALEKETDQATSFLFEVPEELRDLYGRWRPGQHLNLRFVLDSEEHRRSYSISASPVEGPLRITVQRVAGGRVSNHLHDHVRAGDTVEAMPPGGSFCLDPDPKARRSYYFFAAGSGITPLFAMMHAVLAEEPHSYVYLLYGNRDDRRIIFRRRLEELQELFPQRLVIEHCLSRPRIFSLFKAHQGRVDQAALEWLFERHPPYAQDVQYYVCGPGAMNRSVMQALLDLDVPRERIRMESYGGDTVELDDAVVGVPCTARIELDGDVFELAIPKNKTVLAALLDAGHPAPYACRAGVCSTCKAHLTRGETHLRTRAALDDRELEEGFITTCQAIPLTERITVRFAGT